jgi:hypothetical protein
MARTSGGERLQLHRVRGLAVTKAQVYCIHTLQSLPQLVDSTESTAHSVKKEQA